MTLPKTNQSDDMLFSLDDERKQNPDQNKWKILVVDDDDDVIAVTRLVFASFSYEGRGVQIFTAASYKEAVDVLHEHNDFAMAFVDVVMETDHAGLDLVRYIRDTLQNNELQIVLRTGQPGYAPEMQVILEYGINDYRTKTELDNVKLVTALVSALRNYKNIVSARQAIKEQEVAKAVNKSKTLFFAQISHDFRAPLNGILGFCQLLNISPLNQEQQEQVSLIQQSGNHLLALVNDILDLSKAEAGKIQLDIIPLRLTELIEDTSKLLKMQLKNGVSFETEIASNVPEWVLGDPVRIKQLLHNLLSNSIKFTDSGFVKLRVSAQALDEPNCKLQFDIIDTGIGIAPGRIETLFTAYEQADTAITRSYGGTGLGLAICKQLAGLMCGDIFVQSVLGKGSTFSLTIELPMAKSQVLEQSDISKLKPIQVAEPSEFAHILVVDDDAINRMLIKKMLMRRGFNVETAEDGLQACELCQQQNFDLIFMDCVMPNMDGFSATKNIRKQENAHQVPIVALTGSDPGEDMQKCFKAGMNDFIQKPIDMETLQLTVSKWLGFRTMMK